MSILPEQTTALANAIPEGGYSAKQLIDAYKTSDATYALNSGNQNDLYASSRYARGAVSTASQKLDQNIARTTGVNPAPYGYGVDGKPIPNPNASGPVKEHVQAVDSENFKIAYDKQGNQVQIPKSANAAQYGFTDTQPVGGTAAGTAQSGTQTEDPYAKAMSDYNTLLDQNAADRTTKDAEWQSRLDETQKSLISSIEKKYEARRLKMQDLNSRMLEGKRIAGISAGRSRYAPGMEEGVLSTAELDGQARLAEIDAEELSLIAQAKQARDEASYNAFVQSMDRMDALAKEKLDVITKLHENAVAQDKALEDKRKTQFSESQTLQQNSLKLADSLAPSVSEVLKGLKSQEEKTAYLTDVGKKYGVDAEILMSSIGEYETGATKDALDVKNIESQIASRQAGDALEARRESRLASQDKKESVAAKKSDAFASINYLLTPEAQQNVTKSGGIPYMDANGYLTPEGFKTLVSAAAESGVSRKEFLAEYGPMLYLEENSAAKYGITAAEAKLLKSATPTSVIDKEFIKKTYPDLDEEETLNKVDGFRKAGYTDKEIIALLNKE